MSLPQQVILGLLGVVLLALAVVLDGSNSLVIISIFAVAGILILVLAITNQIISEVGFWKGWLKMRQAVKELQTVDFQPTSTLEPTLDPTADLTAVELPAVEKTVFEEDQESKYTATTKDDKKVAVFALREVPLTVLTSLIDNWPEGGPQKPDDLSEFEYAARQRGKGNFAWYVKFKNSAFWVWLGRGRVKVTIANAEEASEMKKHTTDSGEAT